MRYTLKGPLDRVELEVAHVGSARRSQPHLVAVCAPYHAAVQQWQDAQTLAASWSQFWSSLLDQQPATSGALLLAPATRYTLEVQTSWAYRREDGSVGAANSLTDSYSFTTTATPPATLRGPIAGMDATDWEVRTIPAHQATGVYPTRPIRLELADAGTDQRFAAFGQQLIVHLVDEHGEDLFDRLAFLREHARELPEYQRAWRDYVIGLPCAAGGLDALWAIGVAHFPSILAIDRRYDGALVMVPSSVTDPTTITDWEALPVVYRFGFTTSRFPTLAAHLAAYTVFDEICEQPADLAALAAAIGPAARRSDAQLLERALHDHLHLMPRQAHAQILLNNAWIHPDASLLGRRAMLATPRTQPSAPPDLATVVAGLRLVGALSPNGQPDVAAGAGTALADRRLWCDVALF